MPTLRRRSARLAGQSTSTPTPPPKALTAANRLSSLVERSETPPIEQSLNALVSPPMKSGRMPGAFEDDSIVQTPASASRPQPGHDEMHPSKAHHSTTKNADNGLILGFTDMSSGTHAAPAVEKTPTKSTLSSKTEAFNFNWASREDNLSTEAQRIMESVREEAARIKEQLKAERDAQIAKDNEAGRVPGRKYARPKGRFSDAHKEEFNKMDSIADHVSAAKHRAKATSTAKTVAKPAQSTPKKLLHPQPPPISGVKRTKSRMDLNEQPPRTNEVTTKQPGGTASEKRRKTKVENDVSANKPVPPHNSASTPRHSRPLPSFMTTPTRASLAKASSSKASRIGKALSFSPSKYARGAGTAPKSEGSGKYLASLARIGSVRSILSPSRPKFSNDPIKIAAGTHVPFPTNGDKNTASGERPVIRKIGPVKHVGFALDTITAGPSSVAPMPLVPSVAARPHATVDVKNVVQYPDLRTASSGGPLSSNPPTPGDFTFRSEKPIEFGPQATRMTSPTIRRVRPSGIATPVQAFPNLPAVPHGMPNKKRRRSVSEDYDIENVDPILNSRDTQSPNKKARTVSKPASSPAKITSPFKRKTGGSSPKKPGLSLSRMNLLARPKKR